MKVLIAIDDFRTGERIAQVAHRLFGDEAEYLVMNVANDAEAAPGVGWAGLGWGAAYPLAVPLPVAPLAEADVWSGAVDTAKDRAQRRADDVVEAAHLGPTAEPIGEVGGDEATAICRAADEHAVDVVVVGSHTGSWFGRLFSRDVAGKVLRETAQPVLVVG